MRKSAVVLDGLQDPTLARRLSAAWHAAGVANVLDPAGQAAWLWPAGVDAADASEPSGLDEDAMDRAACIARRFGLEMRDRVGARFDPDVELPTLRARIAWEYKSRLATAVVFGLPALALHYLGPVLAGGAGRDATGAGGGMALPWLIEGLLAGWVCMAAGWPVLWQGALSLRHGRLTADLLTAMLVGGCFIASAVGVLGMAAGVRPWFVDAHGQGAPLFDVTVWAVLAACAQRWALHAHGQRLAGRGNLMLTGHRWLIGAWAVAAVLMAAGGDVRAAAAWVLALPVVMSSGAVNRFSPGWLSLPAVAVFAWLVSGVSVPLPPAAAAVRVEAAAMFSLAMTGVFAWCWRGFDRPAMDSVTNRQDAV
jgi:hypothetical protein